MKKTLPFFCSFMLFFIFCLSRKEIENTTKIIIIFSIIFSISIYSYMNEEVQVLFKKVKRKVSDYLKIPLIRFGIGGIPGAIIGFFILLLYTPPDHPKSIEEKYLSILVFIIAFFAKESINFPIHKWWTYKNKEQQKTIKEIFIYFSTMMVLLLANTTILYILKNISNIGSAWYQVILNLVFASINSNETKKVFIKKTRSV